MRGIVIDRSVIGEDTLSEALGRSLSPFDVALGIDCAGCDKDVLICVVQIERYLCSVERVVLRDRLSDGDITELDIVLDRIYESIAALERDLLVEILAVLTSCPSGRSCIGILDSGLAINCLRDKLSDLI